MDWRVNRHYCPSLLVNSSNCLTSLPSSRANSSSVSGLLCMTKSRNCQMWPYIDKKNVHWDNKSSRVIFTNVWIELQPVKKSPDRLASVITPLILAEDDSSQSERMAYRDCKWLIELTPSIDIKTDGKHEIEFLISSSLWGIDNPCYSSLQPSSSRCV